MAKAGNEQADFEEEIVTKIAMDVIDLHFTENKNVSEDEMNTISMRMIDDILKELDSEKEILENDKYVKDYQAISANAYLGVEALLPALKTTTVRQLVRLGHID